MDSRRTRRLLTEEEIELWARVTRNDEPLARPQPLCVTGEPAAQPGASEMVAVANKPQKKAAAPKPPVAPARNEFAAAPPQAPFDPRITKRIVRGRHAIDARLDLHGLRQHDAYGVLRRFLARCQADGLRHVLVITGKGGKPGERESSDFWQGEERGVLRRLVPQWLSEPSFRLHVVSFTESAMKHGGSGALYVTIRKGPRHPAHE